MRSYTVRNIRAISNDARRYCALAKALYNADPDAEARLERLEAEGIPFYQILNDLAEEAWNADLRELSIRVHNAHSLLYG